MCRAGRAVEYSQFPGVWGCYANAVSLFLLLAMCPCVATIQSSRIVVLVHKLERNHSCFDILLIYYFSLKIYFSSCFDEVREGCGCFQDNKGFSTNWSREVGYCCKNATTYLTAVRCRSNDKKRWMVDTPPSPTASFIGVGVEKHV